MTRQAISPRFAIRIFLNISCLLTFGRVPSARLWHAGEDVTIRSYSKMRRRQWLICRKRWRFRQSPFRAGPATSDLAPRSRGVTRRSGHGLQLEQLVKLLARQKSLFQHDIGHATFFVERALGNA